MVWYCEACGDKCKTTHSEQITGALRDSYVTCRNNLCQARFKLSTSMITVVVPPLDKLQDFNLVNVLRSLPAEQRDIVIAAAKNM